MCKPKKQSTRPPYIDPQPGPHIGGPSVGVFPFNPLPPTQGFATKFEKKTIAEAEPVRKLPPSPPLQLNSDSGGAKSEQSKKASALDKKHASPDTTFVTSPPPKSSSDSDGPSPRKAGAIKRPPPPSPDKHKTGAKEPLQNSHHRNSTTYEVEGNRRNKYKFKHAPPSTEKQTMRPTGSLANNTHRYDNSNKTQQNTHENRWTSAPEEQTAKPRKPSSNDKKNRNSTGDKWSSEEEDISNHTFFSNF